MDADVSAWLTTVTPLDDRDDAFLRALFLSESPHSCSGTSLASRRLTASSEAIDDRDKLSENTSDRPEDARTVKKRKRSTWRPKDEIERLRRSVADLETVIAVHGQRQTAASRQPNANDVVVSREYAMWKNVAARQFQRRRDVERENHELRTRVQQQLAVAKSLVRLIHRAQQGLPFEDVPRTITPKDVQVCASRRQETLATMALVFDSLNAIPPHSPFQLHDEEFRATQKLSMPSDLNIRPGTRLAQSCEKRFVPSDVASLGDLL